MKRKITVFLITLMLMAAGAASAVSAATEDIKVYVDGAQVAFPDQKPLINADSRTLVPVRFVSEALGAGVEWQGATSTVTVSHKGKTIVLVTGQKQALVDGTNVTLDTQADIVNSRTMVPLRFVSECLGASVEWDGYKRAVYITTLEKPVTAFVGTAMDGDTFKTFGGYTLTGSDEPGAEYMYVTEDQLPVKFGDETIFSLVPGEESIAVKQSTGDRMGLQMLIIQDEMVIGSRTGHVYEANPFTVQYDTQNLTDVALGRPRVDINKVNAFMFKTRYADDAHLVLLVVKNPLDERDWRP